MESNELQQAFFSTVKNSIPPHLSMVDEIADLLKLSYDSVYRRVRGEKPITMAELKILCEHFHISLDHVLQLKTDSVVFQAPNINKENEEFIDYLHGMLKQLRYFNSFGKSHSCQATTSAGLGSVWVASTSVGCLGAGLKINGVRLQFSYWGK